MISRNLVSIIIPTYQRPLKLERAINSVLTQSYKQLEVIIVDDNDSGSTERKETEELMSKYIGDSRVKYVKHEFNKNGSAARNTGFKNSVGSYIMFLDDDDEFLPKKVEEQFKCLENLNEEWGACYCKYQRKKNGKIVMKSAENREGNLYFEVLCRNLFIHAGSNLMIRRNVFEELKGFDETFQRNQDIEFAVRLLKKYKLAFVDELGLSVNIHDNPEGRGIDVVKVTEHYLENLKVFIKDLEPDEYKQFEEMINLQILRYHLLNSKEYRKVFEMIKNKKVNVYNVFKYINHLLYRKITKKSYGFKLRNTV